MYFLTTFHQGYIGKRLLIDKNFFTPVRVASFASHFSDYTPALRLLRLQDNVFREMTISCV